MTPRQAYALTHPIARADGSPEQMRPLMSSRHHPAGAVLKSILAVDR